MSITGWPIQGMYREPRASIVAGRVVLVSRPECVRLRGSDQLGLGLTDLELVQLRRCLGPICSAEFCARIREMAGDRVLAETEALSDIAVRGACCGDAKDFDFTLCKPSSLSPLRDNARPAAKFVVTPGKSREDVPCPRCSERSERLYRGES